MAQYPADEVRAAERQLPEYMVRGTEYVVAAEAIGKRNEIEAVIAEYRSAVRELREFMTATGRRAVHAEEVYRILGLDPLEPGTETVMRHIEAVSRVLPGPSINSWWAGDWNELEHRYVLGSEK